MEVLFKKCITIQMIGVFLLLGMIGCGADSDAEKKDKKKEASHAIGPSSRNPQMNWHGSPQACPNVVVLHLNETSSEILVVSLSPLLLQLNDQSKTFDLAALENEAFAGSAEADTILRGLSLMIDVYGQSMPNVKALPYCQSNASFPENPVRWMASSGKITITLFQAKPESNLPLRVSLHLESIKLKNPPGKDEVTLESLDLLDIPVTR